MTSRPLLGLITLLASSAALTQPGEAGVYSQPDLSSSVEAKIQNIRTGSWSSLLQNDDATSSESELARAWGNGGGRAWGNGGGRRYYGGGGGWGNGGGGGWLNGGYGGRGFANW